MRWLILASILFSFFSDAQDSIANKKRLNLVRYGGLVTYTVGMIGLNELWYSKTPRESFHFFNDAREWKQVDKVGHFYSAFQISHTSYKALSWANSTEKKRALASSMVGFGILTSIEVFDGFSSGYGASISDLAANAAGSLLFWSQITGWKEIRVQPKFSFNYTSFPSSNPSLLGSNGLEEILKDYNGQTYWLSVNMDKFMPFPKWLNLALGYGATNMVNANDNQNIDPYRQFYLSVDFDVTAIKTKSKIVKGIIYFVNMIKLPAPTLEFSPRGLRGHVFYF